MKIRTKIRELEQHGLKKPLVHCYGVGRGKSFFRTIEAYKVLESAPRGWIKHDANFGEAACLSNVWAIKTLRKYVDDAAGVTLVRSISQGLSVPRGHYGKEELTWQILR